MYESAMEGATWIIRESLRLTDGQELLIVADEAGLQTARVLHVMAHRLGVRSVIAFVQESQQLDITNPDDLGAALREAIGSVHAVINCLNGRRETTGFRGALIDQRRVGLRIAHMPGVSIRMLATAVNADHKMISTQADLLMRPLFFGKNIVIRTAGGRELRTRLDGSKHVPEPSTGEIPDGAWGNALSGEAFVSPVLGSGEGQILIDGSLLGHTVGRRKPVVLTFQGGNLVRFYSQSSELRKLLADHRKKALSQNESNWTNLAEIGIGLNSRITRLTGSALMDEKKAGTAHIAIGRSRGFGGDVECAFHEDMVFKRPTILVDSQPIVESGRISNSLPPWGEDLPATEDAQKWATETAYVSRTGASTEVVRGQLYEVLNTGAGRTLRIRVGDRETARAACALLHAIPLSQDEKIPLAGILETTGLESSQAARMLLLLERRRIVFSHSQR